MKKTVYALTGATGLLGRNVLVEIIKDHIDNIAQLEIIILGRGSAEASLKERVEGILYEERALILQLSKASSLISFLKNQLTYVEIDLGASQIISAKEKRKIEGMCIDHFIHIAALTDFKNDASTKELVYRQNVLGTEKLLKLCTALTIKEFDYVSSAYVCGCTYGDIQPDYTNLNQKFRNPYERTKLQGEALVKIYQNMMGVRCRIFRPSILVGRLMDNAIGQISKFDVFYNWAAFFMELKLKYFVEFPSELYTKEAGLKLRIALNKKAGLNMLAVDFAAKVLYQVCKQNVEGEYFHLVNTNETLHTFYVNEILKVFNFKEYTLLNQIPEESANQIEEHYYKTVGSVFNPYLLQDQIGFNVDNLKDLYETQNIHCPEINEQNFRTLMTYAMHKNFGVDFERILQNVVSN